MRDLSGNAITILNDLTVTKGEFNTQAVGDALTIHGLTNIGANGFFLNDADQSTDKVIHHGLITNLGTYKINDTTTVNMNGGIRQLGTLTIA